MCGRNEGAQFFCECAIALRQKLLGSTPENARKIADDYYLMGDSSLHRKQYALALQHYDASMNMAGNAAHVGDALQRKGFIYGKLGQYERAVTVYKEAVESFETAKLMGQQIIGKLDRRILDTYRSIVKIYQRM